jgi:hypothetical protein
MAAGSSVSTMKTALTALLEARDALGGLNVSDTGPVTAEDLQNDDGAWEAIWFGDTTTVSVEIPFAGTPVTYDETYDQDVVIQVLTDPADEEPSQTAVDRRAEVLLGELLTVLATTPDLDVAATDELVTFDVTMSSWSRHSGWLGNGDRYGCRFVVKVRVEARLTLS